ncbi:MAG: hypothetical protein GY859_12585 [Desulfobacterales bacterium]|nr:hypothetical protein [Desulfobacterales bacterium]
MDHLGIQIADEKCFPSISNLIHRQDMHVAERAVDEAFSKKPSAARVSDRVWRFVRIVKFWDGMIRKARKDVSRSERKKLIAEKIESYGIKALIGMTGDYFELEMFLSNTDFVFTGVGKPGELNLKNNRSVRW